MAYKRLTKTQKAKNKVISRQIRKVWKEKAKGKMSFSDFKKRVINRSIGTGESIKESAKKVGNSYGLGFGDYKKQAKENLLASMKEKFRTTYDELRRKAGRFGKDEHLIDRIEYDSQQDTYILTSSTGERYRIDKDDSPKQMYLTKI